VHELYRDFIETSLELPNPPIAEAFLAAEEDHAASLRHALRLEQGARNRTIPDPAYGEKLAQMRSAEQFAVVKNTGEGRASLSRLNLELDEIEAKYRLRTFAVKRRETQNSRHGTELAQFQSALATGEALLSFYQGEQSLYLWALTRNRFEFHTLRYGYRLSQLAPRFASSVLSQANDRDKIGQELFQNLFGQLSPEIRNQPRWLIAADDDLFRIPFAALTVRKAGNTNVYLAQEHSVIQIPSASILPASEQAPIDGRFVGIGDGIYNTADPRWPGHSNMWRRSSIPRTLPRLQLARLIASGHEIESCAHIWGENSPILLTGIQGSREGLETALTEPSLAIIHIAAHFIYPQNQPDRPVIDLGLNRSSESDVLTIQDVANMHVPSALVVMSGCSSAASKSVPGVGVMGMGRAWLMAGALVVVGSRWPTPDDSGDLFQSFYRHLRTLRKLGSTRAVAEAMRAAQTEMLSSNTWRSDPSYWAAFYVLGKD